MNNKERDGRDQADSKATRLTPVAKDEPYVTDLDFISTWDTIDREPGDAYVDGMQKLFEDGGFDVGENYPRGV
jgi:hypothetical protein